MSTLTSRPVARLGSSSPSLSSWMNRDVEFDFAIAGIPLIGAVDPNSPYARKTAAYRKDQIDQTASPGEQSLVFWWLRSQLSFHAGAGIEYEEPDPSRIEFSSGAVENRFAYSEGLDVFTKQGKAKLLPKSIIMNAGLGNPDGTRPRLMGATDANGVDVLFVGASDDRNGTKSSVFRYDSSPDNGNAVFTPSGLVFWEAGGTTDPIIRSMTNDGSNYYIANAVGIYQGTLAGGNGAKIWNTGSANTTIAWAKQRLVAGIGRKIYELTGVTGAPTLPADGAMGHLYTHANTNWQWTAIAETAQSMLASGYAGGQSAIYRFDLSTTDGVTPAIGEPVITAKLPPGEIVYAMQNVLDAFLAIGTNKGVRIAIIDANGDVKYGPLNVDTNQNTVYGFTVRDRFVYFTWTSGLESGDSCLGIIDLGLEVDSGLFAYSTHLLTNTDGNVPTGTVWGVDVIGASGRLAYVVDDLSNGPDVWFESDGELVSTGTLRTGKIRFHTLEPKLFKFLKVRAEALVGTIEAEFTAADGSGGVLGSWFTAGDTALEEVTFSDSLGPVEWAQVTFTLSRDEDATTTGPTWLGYQVKALPAQKNQRQLLIPVYMYDFEADRNGMTFGYEGYAWTRLKQLEQIEEARDIVLYQALTPWTDEARQVVIDDITFQQQAPPTNFSGFGGVAVITLRTVT